MDGLMFCDDKPENTMADELKKEKAKFLKRRSSLGGRLSRMVSRSALGAEGANGEGVERATSEKQPDKCASVSGLKECENKLTESNDEDLYRGKREDLEEEYKEWKNLIRTRRQNFHQARRMLEEARSGELCIEEDQMQHLSKNQKRLLSSRTNYSEYIQEVQMANEVLVLTLQSVEKTAAALDAYTSSQAKANDYRYELIEEELLRKTDTKKIIRNIKE